MTDGPPPQQPQPVPTGTSVVFPALPITQNAVPTDLPSPTLPPMVQQPSVPPPSTSPQPSAPSQSAATAADMALVLNCVRSGRVRAEVSDELPGWTILYRERQSGRMRTDKYYVSPQGKRYCSRGEVLRAIGAHTPEPEPSPAPAPAPAPAPKRPRETIVDPPPLAEVPPQAPQTPAPVTPQPQPQRRQHVPTTRAKDAAAAAEERSGIKHSRVGAAYQSELPPWPPRGRAGWVDGDRVDDARAAPDVLCRCLAGAAGRGVPRATVAEPCGTCVWRPGVLADAAVAAYLRCTRRLVSPHARYDAEACLTLLARCNYDVDLAARTYAYEQAFITRAVAPAAAAAETTVAASASPLSSPPSPTAKVEGEVVHQH